MRVIILLSLSLLLLPERLIAQEKKRSVIIEVKSKDTKMPIEAARVDIGEYGETETDSKGKALFPDIPEGAHKVQIYKAGYENYLFPNPIKVTAKDNLFAAELSPLPEKTFLLRGRVLDSQNAAPLDSVEVLLQVGARQYQTSTNDWGIFEYIFPKDGASIGQKIILNVRKAGYLSPDEIHYDFYAMQVTIPNVQLQQAAKKAPIVSDKDPKTPRKRKKLQAVWSENMFFSAMGDLNLFQGGTGQDKLSHSYNLGGYLLWNTNWVGKRFFAGFGWRTALVFTSNNTFETLTGYVGEADTRYKFHNILILNTRLYLKSPVEKKRSVLFPFFALSAAFTYQQPQTEIFTEGSLQSTRPSHLKFIPKYALGLSWKVNKVFVEPVLSYSFYKVASQSYKFNYFGHAAPLKTLNKYNNFSVSVSLCLPIIKNLYYENK